MLSLPVKTKPIIDMNYQDAIVTYPNAITKEVAKELIDYAKNESLSGLHQRGSKNSDYCFASFLTCLVFRNDHPIYKILDPLWNLYIKEKNPNITFIEPYEIKIYNKNDRFSHHIDSYGSIYHDIDRKINLIIQLSHKDEYTGGELCVDKHQCSSDFGSAIFFPAQYYHHVKPITAGERISLIGHAWGPVIR